jgi:hypothetical protein
MFDYLNRYYLKNQNMKMLGVIMMEKFNLLFHQKVKKIVLDAVLSLLNKQRNNEMIDKVALKECI